MDSILRPGRMALMFCVIVGLVAGDAFGQRRGRGGESEAGAARSAQGASGFRGAPSRRSQFNSGGTSQSLRSGGQSLQSTRSRSAAPSIGSGAAGRQSFQVSPRSFSRPGAAGGTATDSGRFSRSYRPQSRPSYTPQSVVPGSGPNVISGGASGPSQSYVNPRVVPGTGPSRSAISSDRGNWRPNARQQLPSASSTAPNPASQSDLNRFFRDRSNRGTTNQAPNITSGGTGATAPQGTVGGTIDSMRRRTRNSTPDGLDRTATGGVAGGNNDGRTRGEFRPGGAATGTAAAAAARGQFRPDRRGAFDNVRIDDATRRRLTEHRHTAARHVRHDWHQRFHRDRHHHDIPFRADWWRRHHLHDHHRHDAFHHHVVHHHHVDRPFYWWRAGTVPVVSAWLTFGWPRVYYWNYGPGEYIYCHDNVIYVNGAWFAPAPVYYRHTVLLAQSAPELTPQQAAATEWLPLGVWALTPEGQVESNLLVQIAVTPEGIMGGTVFNQATGQSFPLEGMVDQQTQRAAWTFVDDRNQRVTMETGIFNFTRPEATILTHFGPEQIEVWQMVRLDQPDNGAAQQAPAANGPIPALPAPAGGQN